MRRLRRLFYNVGGPWYRCRLFEALGSERYSAPALFGMDLRLAELMPWRGGVFVEAGAHDGYTQSNTYYLERRRDWSGVLVEAVPELEATCVRRRPHAKVFDAALVGPESAGEQVEVQFGDLMSTSGGDGGHAAGGLAVTGRRAYAVEVPARTLSSVLAEAGLERIDLLVLDVEGHELDVLAGLDLELHGPGVLLIETLQRSASSRRSTRAGSPLRVRGGAVGLRPALPAARLRPCRASCSSTRTTRTISATESSTACARCWGPTRWTSRRPSTSTTPSRRGRSRARSRRRLHAVRDPGGSARRPRPHPAPSAGGRVRPRHLRRHLADVRAVERMGRRSCARRDGRWPCSTAPIGSSPTRTRGCGGAGAAGGSFPAPTRGLPTSSARSRR